MRVLLSIHPKYVERIFNLSKRFEYRKYAFKNKQVDTIVLYSTTPVKKVVGEFDVGEITCDTPEKIWEETNRYSGMSKEAFDEYYYGRKLAFAIKIQNVNVYPNPIDLTEFCGLKRPPQSYTYLKG